MQPIQILTRDEIIRRAPDRWEDQYASYHRQLPNGKTGPEIASELRALQPHEITADRVNQIIGNDGWTVINCSECGEYVEAVAQIGTDPEWGTKATDICLPCLKRAVDALSTPSHLKTERMEG